MGKKKNKLNKIVADKGVNSKESGASQERRKAVRNIVAGSGLAMGAATSKQWVTPALNTVILPAHAQTSGPVVLVGNVNLGAVVNAPGLQQKSSILDFFVESAYAGVASADPNLAGACMSMSITSATAFSLNVEFASAPSIALAGTISSGNISASGSGITVTGTVDTAASTATGTISNGSGTFGFSLDNTQSGCTPIAATTTMAPTTTATPTSTTATPTSTTATPTSTTATPTSTTATPTSTTVSPRA